jgi:hypothetical protein
MAGAGAALVFLRRVRSARRREEEIRLRNARLERKEIPYIAGEAIGPEVGKAHGRENVFFGRHEVLRDLRNVLATTNQAIVGRYRIGKTSILLQLGKTLETLDDPDYVFLPEFIDLSHFKFRTVDGVAADDRFFHYLGGRLLDLAERHSVPREVLDRLKFARVEPGKQADYNSVKLKSDIAALIKYWEAALAPKAPVLVWLVDEVSRLASLDYETLLMFRALLVDQPRLKTVLCGRRIPKERNEPGQSPWWNVLGREITVLPLTPEEARALLVEPVHGLFEFDEDALQMLLAAGEGKPFRLQRLGIAVVNNKYGQEPVTTRISRKDVEVAIGELADEGDEDDQQEEGAA